MAKKKLTPRQQEWKTEYDRLKRRVAEWKRKFHAIVDLPQRPQRITKKDIERLQQFKWKNIDEAQKKQWREEYAYRYENKMPDVYHPVPQYNPPTENDYFTTPEPPPVPNQTYEDEAEDAVDSYEEINAWIEENILMVDQKDGYKSWEIDPEERQSIAKMAQDAAAAAGYSEEYYKYLEEHAKDINEQVRKHIYGYVTKKGRVIRPESNGQELSNIATILNYGRPLDAYQSMELNETGFVTFDITDID